MNFLNQSGLKAGEERYGAKNARPSFDKKATCDHCGADNDPDATKCWQCKQDIDERKNASPSERENEDNFYTCEKCGTTWPETVDRVPGRCPKCGGHPVDVFKGKMGPRIDAGNGRDNADASTLGYGHATSTTTARSKRKIDQKFYKVGNAIACPVCDKPVDGGLDGMLAHLEENHDMTPDQAEAALGVRSNDAGDGMFAPAYLTVADKVALGQREYGAVNASAEEWAKQAEQLGRDIKGLDEDAYERKIETFVDRLDKSFQKGDLTQGEYDAVQDIVKRY